MIDFRFSLEAQQFVGFLSAELQVSGAENCTVSASIAQETLVVSREVQLNSSCAQRFHALAVSALRTYGTDASWERSGLDGTDYRGSFRSPALDVPEFRFWSPTPNTPPHWLASAAFEAVRATTVGDPFDSLLEQMRLSLGHGTPLRWEPGSRRTLRILGGLPIDLPLQLALSTVPEDADVQIDLRSCGAALRAMLLAPDQFFPGLKQLAHRVPLLTWIVGEEDQAWRLQALGVHAERIIVQAIDPGRR